MNKIAPLIVIFAILSSMSLAAIDATFTCKDPRCKEGTPVNYSVYVSNSINGTIEISLIQIRDADTGQTMSTYRLSRTLQPEQDFRVDYEDIVPAPAKGYTFQYTPCMHVKLAGSPESPEVVCDRVKKSMTVLPISKIACEVDQQCRGDEFCNMGTFKCKKLACENYSFPILHRCTNYNALWAIIGIVIAIALVATFFIRQKYKRAKVRNK